MFLLLPARDRRGNWSGGVVDDFPTLCTGWLELLRTMSSVLDNLAVDVGNVVLDPRYKTNHTYMLRL
jgi:hypothetical protein